jgi:hypothetical protein
MADGIEILRQIADPPPDLGAGPPRRRVEAVIDPPPRRRFQPQHQDRQERRLARPVVAEQAEHPPVQLQRHALERLQAVRVGLGDVRQLDHRVQISPMGMPEEASRFPEKSPGSYTDSVLQVSYS